MMKNQNWNAGMMKNWKNWNNWNIGVPNGLIEQSRLVLSHSILSVFHYSIIPSQLLLLRRAAIYIKPSSECVSLYYANSAG
jgi:hypothetical protein